MRSWFGELYRHDRCLTVLGVSHIFLSVLFVLLALVDSRTLLGLNVWIKPAKFALSIVVYSLTFAYIMRYVRNRVIQKLVSYTTSTGFIIDIGMISFQAAQGKRSHFNLETPLDAALYSMMGITIGIVTIAAIILWVYLLLARLELSPHLAAALRFGLLISIVGSVIGGYMAGNNRHSVGALTAVKDCFF